MALVFLLLNSSSVLFGQTAEVVILELDVRYGNGDFGHESHDGGGKPFRFQDDNLAYRMHHVTLKNGDEYSTRCGKLQVKLDFDIHRRVKLRANVRYRASHGSSSTRNGLGPTGFSTHLQNYWQPPGTKGGSETLLFTAHRVLEEEDDSPFLVTEMTPRGFLKGAIARFRDKSLSDPQRLANTIISLGRFFGHDLFGKQGDQQAQFVAALELAQNPEEQAGPRRGQGRRHRVRWTFPVQAPSDQLRLALNMRGSTDQEAEETRVAYRGSDPGIKVGYRYLAENEKTSPEARLVAIHRCLAMDRRIDFHSRWVAMLNDDAFNTVDHRRSMLVTQLNAARLGREIPDLMALVGGIMGALLVTIFMLRRVTRRAITR